MQQRISGRGGVPTSRVPRRLRRAPGRRAGAAPRALFAGTEGGAIRCYRLPLSSGDCQELRCCGGAVTRLALTEGDTLLLAAAADGALFVLDVRDRDPGRGCAA